MEELEENDLGFDPLRLEKRQRLLDTEAEPYPYGFAVSHSIGQVIELAGTEDLGFAVCLAGRIWARRVMGKVCFMDLRDNSGKIQLYLSRKELSVALWERLEALDQGDIMGVSGTVFRTRTGELSVQVETYQVLAKATAPLPIGKEAGGQAFARMADPEARYRERHLHWLLEPAARRRMEIRAQTLKAMRRWLDENDFMEVDTPTVTTSYGGAEARPFTTEVWALAHQQSYLRISPELHLKRYIIAGFDRVFSICQNFRNEGIDRTHNPEFTMLEWYEAFSDYQVQLRRFEELVAAVCIQVHGTTQIHYQGQALNLAPPWRRLTVLDAVRQYAQVDAASMDAAALAAELERRGLEYTAPLSWGQGVMALFEACCEAQLIEPTFVLDHPLEICPLTKVKRDEARLAERFEPYVCGMELGNAYSEETDPVEQARRFVGRRSASEAEWEDHPLDVDFIRAMGCGMPPTGGVGLGVDRLVMLLSDAASIRDVIPFPMVKPKN